VDDQASGGFSVATGRWVLAATILGSSMAFIDGTVVNVALPTLQRDLDASAAAVQWVVEAYALFLAALILVGGSLGDRLGRRRIYTAGVGLFTIASVACGLSQDVGQLIAARALQGVGGALLVPGSLAIISATFAGEARGRAIGTWSGFTAITSAIGPLLGGWLVDQGSWRWVFLINVPIAAVVLWVVVRSVPESRDEETSGRIDIVGAVLVTVGLGLLVFGLIEVPARGWGDPLVLGSLALAVAALASFVAVEARGASPMMPLELFRSRVFSGANVLTFLLYAGLGGALYWVPFNLIEVHGYSSTKAGAALLPMVILLSLLSRWAGGLITSFGPRPPLTVGPAVAGLGFLLFARPGTDGSYWTTFFPAAVVLGVGLAITVAPLTTTVMGAVETRHSGVASGINNAVSRAAGLLAIAILGIVVAGVFEGELEDRLVGLALSESARADIERQEGSLAAIEPPAELDPAGQAAVADAVDASFNAGFRRAMMVGAALAFASSVAAWLMIRGPEARRAAEEGAVAPAASTA
jgi:EmrB/QacA subfamily drug resistance transporter